MEETSTPLNHPTHPVFGMLAGEASGDILGAGLITALKTLFPGAAFIGIGGPCMQQAGLKSLHDMERLSVMGFTEPLKRLPELLKIRSSVVNYFKENPPDVFIGIDAPDFNLGVEKRLKQAGIKTVHYVSPTVWAWREGRIKKIKRAADHVLCLFPFEAELYQKHRLPATFVGHLMADDIPLDIDKTAAKKSLGLAEDGLTLAILPGSRSKEISLLGPVFMQVAKRIQSEGRVRELVVAAATDAAHKRLREMAKEVDLDVRIFLGKARDVLLAADVALAASGTVTLEGMLTKTPMTVAYRLEKLSFWIASRLVKLKYISLPNILADQCLMNEFIQEGANMDDIYADVARLIEDDSRRDELCKRFYSLHQSLRQDASARAAEAVSELITRQEHA